MSRRNSWAGGSALAITVALAAAGALLPMAAQAGTPPLPNGTITAAGVTSGTYYEVTGGSTVSFASNYGTINSGPESINVHAGGTVTFLSNGSTGSINSTANYGIINAGTFGELSNSGTISGTSGGVLVDAGGVMNTLTNRGVISSPGNAIEIAGSIGRLTNSGTIAGTILNSSTNNLTIAGDTTIGTLTGNAGAIGSIVSTSANVVFSSGNLLLNDHINATGRTVTNSGASLRLDNTISITGTYSQTGGGLISTATGNGASYGKLVVTGDASISNSTITVSGAGLTIGQTFTIVDATGTGTYAGNTGLVAVTNGLGATLTMVGNDLVATLYDNAANTWTRKGSAAGGSAVGTGAALDSIRLNTSPTAVAFQNAVLTPLNALPASSQGNAIKQLAPTNSAPVAQMSTTAATAVLGAIQQHQQTAMAYDGQTGAAAGSAARDSTLWGQFIGGGARRGTNSEADGYTLLDFGVATGVDHRFTPNVLGGVAVSWLRAWTEGSDNSSGSSSTFDNYQLTFYGTYRLDRAFIDGQLGAGWNHFDQSRAINFLGSTASATYEGQQYLAKATVGYDLPVGGVTVTPMASLRWLHVASDGYEESGAGAANLSVDSSTFNSVSQDLGAKVAWSVPTGAGTLKPEVKLAWVHDYTNSPIATSGVMGGSAFAVNAPRTAADGARIGFAAELAGDEALSLRAEYEGELRTQYQSHTGLIKAMWGF